MEATRKTTRKKGTPSGQPSVAGAYKQWIRSTGKPPVSVYSFCTEAGITEDGFYSTFGSFQGLERAIWKELMETTTGRLTRDKAFATFTAQEKILALYYTLLEELLKDRSYVVWQLNAVSRLDIVPPFLRDFRQVYEEFVSTILAEGQASGEIARRPYLDNRYPQLFWLHVILLLQYWKDDNSPSFEKTDAYVEKSVRLAFDLIGRGAIDSVVDFARFMLQSRFK